MKLSGWTLFSILMMAVIVGPFDAVNLSSEAQAADSKSLERKRSYGLRKKVSGHIQMRSVIAPVKRSKKSRRAQNTPVTVVLTVNDNSRIGKICNKGPRISDALLRAWYNNPMTADYLYDRSRRGKTNVNYRRTPAQKKEDQRLVKVVNRALGSRDVTGILVIKGSMSMGGGTVTKLPFSSVNGCDELQEKKKKKK